MSKIHGDDDDVECRHASAKWQRAQCERSERRKKQNARNESSSRTTERFFSSFWMFHIKYHNAHIRHLWSDCGHQSIHRRIRESDHLPFSCISFESIVATINDCYLAFIPLPFGSTGSNCMDRKPFIEKWEIICVCVCVREGQRKL